jgi:hypothetical protein
MQVAKKIAMSILASTFMSLNFAGIAVSSTDSTIQPDSSKTATVSQPDQPILSLLETNLDSTKSKAGDEFSAKTTEDIILGDAVIVPKSSIVAGTVFATKKAGRLSKDASITLKITRITTPDEKIISIADKQMVVEIFPLTHAPQKASLARRLPGTIADVATSAVIGQVCPFGRFVATGIGLSTGAAVSSVIGWIYPEDGKSRLKSSTTRAYSSSPIGYADFASRKGKNFSLLTGQYINIIFDKATINYIKEIATNT